MTRIGATVTGWWGYCEKVCVHIHVKQFDRIKLDAKEAGVSSYSIYFFFFGNDLVPVVVIIAIVVIMTINIR